MFSIFFHSVFSLFSVFSVFFQSVFSRFSICFQFFPVGFQSVCSLFQSVFTRFSFCFQSVFSLFSIGFQSVVSLFSFGFQSVFSLCSVCFQFFFGPFLCFFAVSKMVFDSVWRSVRGFFEEKSWVKKTRPFPAQQISFEKIKRTNTDQNVSTLRKTFE